MKQQRNIIISGLRDGIPIAMGYYAVAFSLGIIAKKAGLTVLLGYICSFFTRASAGEYGAYTLMAVGASYAEIVAMGLVTNLRYLLMSSALSQKIAPTVSLPKRLLMACCITDEVFGVSIGYPARYVPFAYTISVAFISTIFWAAGTASGIYAGEVLPTNIVTALSVALYGMFIAIIVPPSKADCAVLYAVIASFALSGLCAVAPYICEVSPGIRTIMLTVLIASVMAWLRPVDGDTTKQENVE